MVHIKKAFKIKKKKRWAEDWNLIHIVAQFYYLMIKIFKNDYNVLSL